MSVTPQEVGSFFITLIVPITTGAVAAALTTYLSLNRFYREKWWEKKHVSYNQLIDKLFELKDFYAHASNFTEMQYEAMMGERSEPKGSIDWNKLSELRAQVQRLYVLSPISFSGNVKALLDDLLTQDSNKNYSIYEEGYLDFIAYHEMSKIIQSSIDAIVEDAKSELRFN